MLKAITLIRARAVHLRDPDDYPSVHGCPVYEYTDEDDCERHSILRC